MSSKYRPSLFDTVHLVGLDLLSGGGRFLGGSILMAGSHSPGGRTITSSRNSSIPASRSCLSLALYAMSWKTWTVIPPKTPQTGSSEQTDDQSSFFFFFYCQQYDIIQMLHVSGISTSSDISVAMALPISWYDLALPLGPSRMNKNLQTKTKQNVKFSNVSAQTPWNLYALNSTRGGSPCGNRDFR